MITQSCTYSRALMNKVDVYGITDIIMDVGSGVLLFSRL